LIGSTSSRHVASTDRYAYGANGKRARIETSGADDAAELTYDARGRLVHYMRSGSLHGEHQVFSTNACPRRRASNVVCSNRYLGG
jgi:hypothetical protein